MTARVFVYGTLMPGEPRWPILSPLSSSRRTDRVAGRLIDTGYGYPGLLEGHGQVHGWVVDLAEPDVALPMLDAIEGTTRGLYQRVLVTTGAGAVCWTYRYLQAKPGDCDLDGQWHSQPNLPRPWPGKASSPPPPPTTQSVAR